MAKKQIANETFDQFLERQYGVGVTTTADTIVQKPRDILKTILSLDIALNGGIPDGRIVLLSGKPKAGKTYLCLQILKNAILAKRDAFYFNVERRCSAEQVKQVCGDTAKELKWIESTQESILSAEDWLNILERAIKDHPKAVIVVDSLAQLSTMAEQTEDFGANKDMAGTPKLLYSFFRRMQQIIDSNDVIVIFISHVITSRNPRGKKWVEKGGVGIQYASSVWINTDWFSLWPPNSETNEIDGQDVNVRVMASALGKPYMPCTIPLRYGVGVDVIRDVIVNAENLGLISKAGSWYSIPMFGEEKYQGIPKLQNFLTENPDKADELEKKIRELLLPEVSYDAGEIDKRENDKSSNKKQSAKSTV